MKVLALVDRDGGHSRCFVIDRVSVQDIDPILARNLADEAHLMTDEQAVYLSVGGYYSAHSRVNSQRGRIWPRAAPCQHR